MKKKEIQQKDQIIDATELLESEDRTRKVIGPVLLIVNVICVMMVLFQLYTAGFGQLIAVQQRAVHLAFGLAIVFLLYPMTKKSLHKSIPWYDYILATVGVAVNLYLVVNLEELALRAGNVTTTDLIMGILAMLILLEAARRVVGNVLTGIATFFLLYTLFGNYFPGGFAHRGFSIESVVRHMYLTTEGIYGVPLGVSASFIFLFILMGTILTKMGTAQLLIDMALCAFGKQRGGPAKAAVCASALFGMISGSSVANIACVGSFTIPLMKRIGYKSYFAGSVEAASSIGGQIMPPIMGAAAFIMAEFIGVPYLTVCLAALVPAFLYFLAIFFGVHQEAVKQNLSGLPSEEIPKFKDVIVRGGYLILPLIGIVVALVLGYTPAMAGFVSVVMAILLSFLRPESRLSPKRLFEAFAEGAKNAIEVLVACAVVGYIVGSFTLTGMGLKLAGVVIAIGGGNLILTLVLTALASLILGMGVPTTANYVMMAMITVPALVELGIVPMAAHLFCFYFGIIADLTPPVALASLAASGIARSSFWPTAINASKLGFTAYIVPFFFALSPVILIGVLPFTPMFIVTLTATIIGVMLFSSGLYNFLLIKMYWYERILALVGALALIDPRLGTTIAGAICLSIVLLSQTYRKKRLQVDNLID